MSSRSLCRVALLFLAGVTAPLAGTPSRIHTTGPARPPIVDEIELPEDFERIAVGPAGKQLAFTRYRLGTGKKPKKQELNAETDLLLHRSGETKPASWTFPGQIRDLLFSEDGARLWLLHYKPSKSLEGVTLLIRLEIAELKTHREVRVPPSASALDSWPAEQALIVASRNEIRALLFPGPRSGPLFRFVGENLALVRIGPGLVLIGQQDGLLLADLYDPPALEGHPVRDRVATPGAVVDLAWSSTTRLGLAQLADGRVLEVGVAPLSVGPVAATAPALAPLPPPLQLTATAAAEPTSMGAEADDAPEPPPVAVATDEAPAPEASPAPSVDAVEPLAPAAEPTSMEAEAEDAPEPLPVAAAIDEAPAPEASPVPSVDAVEPVAAAVEETAALRPEESVPAAPPPPRVRGLIVGDALDRVVAVLLLGPDNVLREAARIRPDAEGRWEARELPPGRYRVQLDGGGSQVLLTDPAFTMIDVDEAGSPVEVEIRLLRSL